MTQKGETNSICKCDSNLEKISLQERLNKHFSFRMSTLLVRNEEGTTVPKTGTSKQNVSLTRGVQKTRPTGKTKTKLTKLEKPKQN
jgi:hypothetical protein